MVIARAVAARAPDAAEDFVALSAKFPTMPVRAGVQERDGFTNLSEEAFLKYFANGVARDALAAQNQSADASDPRWRSARLSSRRVPHNLRRG